MFSIIEKLQSFNLAICIAFIGYEIASVLKHGTFMFEKRFPQHIIRAIQILYAGNGIIIGSGL
jgi:hypothetical protein